jgi:hypothetical protein
MGGRGGHEVGDGRGGILGGLTIGLGLGYRFGFASRQDARTTKIASLTLRALFWCMLDVGM